MRSRSRRITGAAGDRSDRSMCDADRKEIVKKEEKERDTISICKRGRDKAKGGMAGSR